jgi:hypothetical protein
VSGKVGQAEAETKGTPLVKAGNRREAIARERIRDLALLAKKPMRSERIRT